VNHQRNHRYDQQQVNQPTRNVEGEKPYLLNNCRNVEGRTETGAGAAAARVKHF
jgi:hypothetical protein